MQETSLHASLKNLYSGQDGRQEVPVDGYLIDVVSGDLLIEIQTRNFTALKPKLTELLSHHQVHLVHPIAQEKWITRLPLKGEKPINRRKSPKRGRVEHLFLELVRIPHLVAHPNLTLEILLIREEEIRRNDGRGSWRRRGWSITDRCLVEVVERQTFVSPDDFRVFIPEALPQPFTASELASALGIPGYLARKMVYCLRAMNLIEDNGKRGRANLYVSAPAASDHIRSI